MTIESARRFILDNSGALYKGHPKHQVYLEAIEVVEQFKRENEAAIKRPPKVYDNPKWGRKIR